MSQEIIEGIQAIEKEKGIEEGVLITALEDALRAAYRKTPGATRHAEVKLDDVGEFRVFGIEIPEDIEVRLVEDAREARITELEQLEEETGERQHTLITDEDLELDWSQVPADQIHRTDVTPDNFGGDAFCFRSHLPHSYCNAGDEPASILWTCTPPTF